MMTRSRAGLGVTQTIIGSRSPVFRIRDKSWFAVLLDEEFGEAFLLDGGVIVTCVAGPCGEKDKRRRPDICRAVRPIRRDIGRRAFTHGHGAYSTVLRLQQEIAFAG